jgi:hypothetical protein
MSIVFRIESNPLTIPHSYWLRFMARDTADEKVLAADISKLHPNFSKEDIETILKAEDQVIMAQLLKGNQVTKKGSFSWFPSCTTSLLHPDDKPSGLNEFVNVNMRVSQVYIELFRQAVEIEREAMHEKLPVISSTRDTLFKLDDVLSPVGLLYITGSNLLFDPESGIDQCVIEGTREGRVVQSRFGTISNTEFFILPDLPSQTQPWNNEYRLLLSTRYTENGTLRTGTYHRMLRCPLGVRIGDNPGILSGGGTVPLVTVSGGGLSAEGAQVRVQAVYNVPDANLRLSLLDMKEGGKVGNTVQVSGNGVYTLPGYAGGAVTSLEVTVADYSTLLAMVRNPYGGRLVDILDVGMGT